MEEEQITGPGRCSPSMAALAVALQHPLVSSDPKAVCSLLQVCKAWRAVVQQSAAGTTMVSLDNATPPTLTGFAAWMTNHAGMLGQLRINMPPNVTYGSLDGKRAYLAVAEPVMSMSLRLAANGSIEPGATAAPARKPLRLRSFSSNMLHSPAILSALPAASLTQLQLFTVRDGVCRQAAALAAALAQLTMLRQLTLTCCQFPGSCLSGISRLGNLTDVRIDSVGSDINTQQLPQQLQKLVLTVCSSSTEQGVLVDFGHLIRLQELQLYFLVGLSAPGSRLPTQLRSLNIAYFNDDESPLVGLGITGLQQLQQLTVASRCRSSNRGSAQQLHQLASLPQLQQLVLHYWWKQPAVEAAPVWKHLSQLRDLDVALEDGRGGSTTAAELAIVLRGVAAARQLTRLKLATATIDVSGVVEVCSHLKGLSQLQELEVDFIMDSRMDVFKRWDAMQLTSLTALTKLGFGSGWTKGVGDAVAVALACGLTQLQWLSLYNCGLHGAAALPAIARLSNLRHLCLCGNEGIDEEGLMLLTRLSRLTHLDLCDGNQDEEQEPQFTAAVAEQFWAAVRGQP